MIKRAVNLVEASATQSAIRVVATEREGLQVLEDALAGPLAAPFCNAVKAIGEITGRVIVTGVGKSGHIGSKIAATFASTGTPAFFVHPSEANHGDLGMIAQDDAILAISWGGETTEMQGILNYSRRFSIPLIAITSGETSTLARNADVVLLMPKVMEACPHGLAPTSSAVLQLAIGDAIAIALLEARGFSPSDFRTFHPGGKLGAALTHVRDIMHTGERVPLVPLGTAMPEAVKTLSHKRFGCVGVVDADGKLCGIVTEGDMARNLARDLSVLNVEDVMTRNPKVIKGDALATTAAATINKLGIGALMVVDDHDQPIGLIHFHDLLRIGVA
ncbi:MAG: KpsF/GutQ family sugar-phosphate isomerase [Rhizobium sp.]|nr:KpsF/GutQ family sugar-phosphate isomerase [Rhizobium sp.]